MVGCTLICDAEQFEVGANFDRVPCVSELIEPQGDVSGWPNDAVGTPWRVSAVRWALSDSGSMPFVYIERTAGARRAKPSSETAAEQSRRVQEIIAELKDRGIEIQFGPAQ